MVVVKGASENGGGRVMRGRATRRREAERR